MICSHECKNEDRLRKIEISESIMITKIDSLIKQLDELTLSLRNLLWVSIPFTIAAIGFLFTYWVKGG